MQERKGFYPLMATAAVSVIVLSLSGIAAIMGWLPTSRSAPADLAAKTAGAPAHSAATECGACGKIESIRTISVQDKPSGLGAIAGGVVGGILGHQIGGGTGKDLATIGGAAGGAYLGNEVEKGEKRHASFRIVVLMDDGTRRTLRSGTQNFNIGEKVKIVDDKIVPIAAS